jgi:pyruvate kinase
MRKTKVICTIGPASENEQILTQMCLAGMNVARLNFSHGTHEEHQKKIDLIKSVREKLNLPIAIMLDTKGPEYRIGTFAEGVVEVATGDTFTFTTDDIEGDATRVSVNYKDLIKNLVVGDRILVCNGMVIFEVMELNGNDAVCRVVIGGTLSNRKSMSFPNKVMPGPFLSEQDKADLLFGIENDVDFVAASFVSTRDDMIEMRYFLDNNGGRDIDIIAKIENRSGVDNVEEICEVCEGIETLVQVVKFGFCTFTKLVFFISDILHNHADIQREVTNSFSVICAVQKKWNLFSFFFCEFGEHQL